ncbi:L-threonylcarbamoyladenylate synthase [Demequina sp. SYSU T00192]|uniref:L-threonylcarbamoyladenylate synthase n=1 Tax=Demequina litoralis TaxID=3051660 RepID=A0ABT8G6S1_9MICO|nr:L-threonylcarbamoyladenylate synthase [Demequina sp. SYSU T00192]MDN4474841.1 L-threonylcarbamoyladenylate synthase [Demequina sp. SYSU T00192]
MLDTHDPATWGPSLDAAVDAVNRGAVIVLPTDTVYGVGADAFSPPSVARLLDVKGRGRQMPPPVLIPDVRTVDGLAREVSEPARALMEACWPGALTVIVLSQPSLAWDLGDTHGTVALRVPDHEAALALLTRTGPLAVTSANRTGEPAATSAAGAEEQLGDKVAVYLDAGDSPLGVASTIVDATGDRLRIVREGGISRDRIVEIVGEDAVAGDDG